MAMVERIDSKMRMESKIDQSHLNSRKETKRNKDKRKEESLVLCKPRCRFRKRDFVRASVRYIVRDEP